MNDFKTIAEIAAEIGVSRQAIYLRLKNNDLLNAVKPFTEKQGKVTRYSIQGVELIKEAFLNNPVNYEVKQLTDNLSESQATCQNLSSELNSCKADLENTVKELEQLRKKVQSLETANAELSEKSSDIDSLTDKCKALETNCEALETALSEKENYINSQTDDLKAAQEKIKEFETANAELKMKSNGLETELSEKKNYISVLEADKEKAIDDIDDLKNQLKEKEASAKEDREKDRQERQTILTRLWQTEDKNKALETELNHYKALVNSKGESPNEDEQPVKVKADDLSPSDLHPQKKSFWDKMRERFAKK